MKKDALRLMEVCGTHTMAIARFGIKKILPENVELISGPGCPVCVTHQADIDRAIATAALDGVVFTTFGDMMRVPGSSMRLMDLRQKGHDIRVVYSCMDALDIAAKNPKKKIIFMGVGFETTSPTVASTILDARRRKVKNFFILSNFKNIFPALNALASSKRVKIDGFICPGHVSVITGTRPYEILARKYKIPCVITGFDDTDIIEGIKELIKNIKDTSYKVSIAYKRAVNKAGNIEARRILASVFESCPAQWRGLGKIPESGLRLRKEFSSFDVAKIFNVKVSRPLVKRGCICADILQGIRSPGDCRLFKSVCNPENPIGPCMVSTEGTCAAFYKYGE